MVNAQPYLKQPWASPIVIESIRNQWNSPFFKLSFIVDCTAENVSTRIDEFHNINNTKLLKYLNVLFGMNVKI